MADDFLKDKVFTKNTGIVLAAEAGSGLGAVIITPFLDKLLHNKDSSVRRVLAKIIQPHLEEIEKGTGIGRELHAYDEAQHSRLGDLEPYKKLSPEKRAERIADTLLDGTAAFVTENGLSIGIQALLKKATNSNIKPIRTGIAGAATHLGVIAVSATVLSKPTEWMYHKISDILPKITNMSAERARQTARNITYVVLPGIFALLTETVVANQVEKSRRK